VPWSSNCAEIVVARDLVAALLVPDASIIVKWTVRAAQAYGWVRGHGARIMAQS
jgi:hypothetical protein